MCEYSAYLILVAIRVGMCATIYKKNISDALLPALDSLWIFFIIINFVHIKIIQKIYSVARDTDLSFPTLCPS